MSEGNTLCARGIVEYGADQWSVECYDPAKNKWIKKTTIPAEMISKDIKDSFRGCVLKLSKGVLDKLDAI